MEFDMLMWVGAIIMATAIAAIWIGRTVIESEWWKEVSGENARKAASFEAWKREAEAQEELRLKRIAEEKQRAEAEARMVEEQIRAKNDARRQKMIKYVEETTGRPVPEELKRRL